jgi:hypothetical protein
MKKNIFLAFLALTLSACTFNEYGGASDSDYYSEVFTVRNNQWLPIYDSPNKDYLLYYYCTFREPLLSEEVINYRSIDAYYELADKKLAPLPYSHFAVNDNEYQWEEQLTVEYEPGYITFILKFDDLKDEPPLYNSYRFLIKFPL